MHLKPIPTTIHSDMVPYARDQTQDTEDADTQGARPRGVRRGANGGRRRSNDPHPADKKKKTSMSSDILAFLE